MSKFKIRHITKYTYEDMVRDSANQIMLYPLIDNYQHVLDHNIRISGNQMVSTHVDYFGNLVGTFTNAQPHNELTIDSQLVVETKSRPMPTDVEPAQKQWDELKTIKSRLDIIDYTRQEKFTAYDEVQEKIEEERCKDCSPLESAKHFSEYIFKNFAYKKGITTVESTLDEVWKLKSGVCQDFAHILLVMLKQINIPARYVSGYICPNKNGMRGEGATHAWVEAYIPFYGWLGLDPTNNVIVNETHVRLAVGKNFSDCSPVKGTYRGTSNHTLDVVVSVSYEDGENFTGEIELSPSKPHSSSTYKNSFRKFQEIQMQQ